jgi:hypothetical protein
MEAVGSSKTLAHLCQNTGRHILEYIYIYIQNTAVFSYCFRLFHHELQSYGRNKLQITQLCICC